MSEELRGVDHLLVRQLQDRLGARRQAAIEERRRRQLPPLDGDDAVQHGKQLVQAVVTQYEADLAEDGQEPLKEQARQDLVEALEARLHGAGSLQQLLEDGRIEDISINGYRRVFVHYADGTKAQLAPVAVSDEHLIEEIQTLAAHVGSTARAFDLANPRVWLRLHDGSRLYATHPAISPIGATVSIRKHRYMKVTLKELVDNDTLDEELAEFLSAIVRARKNVMIAGEVSAGKTTLLRAMASEIPAQERILTVERVMELGLHEDAELHPDCVPLEERLPNAEGVGEETMAALVRDSLRMNPSRVIVGEVLGDEVITMLNAMMQGNDGSLSTIHANSSADVAAKIATYAIQSPERLPFEATLPLVAAALNFIVFVRRIRTPDGGQRRVVESVRELAGYDEDGLKTNQIWSPGPDGMAVRDAGKQIMCEQDLLEVGWTPGESGWV